MDYLRKIISNHQHGGDGEHDVLCDQQTTRRRTFDAKEKETQSHANNTIGDLPSKVLATSFINTSSTELAFLPDYTEHPKPKRRPRKPTTPSPQVGGGGAAGGGDDDDKTPIQPETSDEIAFFQDFVAGGVAGCASVVVGHPFDTMKVRMQTSSGTGGLLQTFREFGGFSTIFRGMGAPLAAATAINAIVFGSYGFSSRLYDQKFGTTTYDEDDDDDENIPTHDPWQKSMTCGSFAGATQCLIICPMEHIKCRLQTQDIYQGSVHAIRQIVTEHGWQRLYQGWWSTAWREIPAFGLYFATYDHLKDRANNFLLNRERQKLLLQGQSSDTRAVLTNTHTWLASAVAGGCAGSLTWAIVYPVDVIKSHIQTAPLDTPFRDLRMWTVGQALVAKHGYRYLFRGLGITLVRAFPVNGTIFPVYEFTLKQVSNWEI